MRSNTLFLAGDFTAAGDSGNTSDACDSEGVLAGAMTGNLSSDDSQASTS